MSPARTVFMGSPAFAVPSFEALVARADLVSVVGVVTQPDKPAGRGRKLTSPPVKLAAAARGLRVLQPAKLKVPETYAALAELAPDLIVVAAYGRILPPPILGLPPRGCVNVHASLLPRHRGASPVAHAILAGDRETGVSIMRMEEGLDTGPIYAQRAISLAAADTTGSLTEKLAVLGADLLVEILSDLLAGRLSPASQSEQGATYAPLLAKHDGWLDFTRPAVLLERRVRAMSPWPLAFTSKGGERLQVLAARVTSDVGTPGTIVAAGPAGVTVACSEGALLLERVKPAGKGSMGGGAWAAGRGALVGDRFDREPPTALLDHTGQPS